MTFLWKGHSLNQNSPGLPTTVLYNHYETYKRENWQSAVEDRTIPQTIYTQDFHGTFFKEILAPHLSATPEDTTILFPFGGDAAFQSASYEFELIEKLIEKLDGHKYEEYVVSARYGSVKEFFELIGD